LIVEVSDDGRGVDAAKIKAKAIRTGVITAEQAEHVRAESRRLAAFATGNGNPDAWRQAWESRSTFDDAPPAGWFDHD